eukprot:CAMPEP_0181172994 /NCGR_PEP_ID=MMETSP1096-20121128/2751_1 /TAXON_ID=156174 ORGANISM="Chrysochromulina ericina, Strain CCMP281" /NCGR_SAMPLE_ID=MMETSP1096 /ASSEMBLY_ACC=CAM_ASM_000453 /LENGTH=50 /DNA_ID=CAMNT_0023260769 /DNA_START=311 /DNA_END=463 /DNA_ORIENTATION=+
MEHGGGGLQGILDSRTVMLLPVQTLKTLKPGSSTDDSSSAVTTARATSFT